MIHDPATVVAQGVEARDRSLQDDLRDLADEARTAAEAEFAFQKSRATYAGKSLPKIAGLLVGAAVLAFFAMMALVVGLIIALAPLLTAWGSMALVTIVLLGLALVVALVARSKFKETMVIIGDDRSSESQS
ncbi:phage holin family protein [Novosphingobium aquimarinum]|uniref:phage holin family protein n=1 Tax=Novosphingobium aquimarinum TaxID=2682494 RepID=UPI0012EBD9B4|nr:phage holin family protein [Novosphingobium aquimarinum]